MDGNYFQPLRELEGKHPIAVSFNVDVLCGPINGQLSMCAGPIYVVENPTVAAASTPLGPRPDPGQNP